MAENNGGATVRIANSHWSFRWARREQVKVQNRPRFHFRLVGRASPTTRSISQWFRYHDQLSILVAPYGIATSGRETDDGFVGDR